MAQTLTAAIRMCSSLPQALLPTTKWKNATTRRTLKDANNAPAVPPPRWILPTFLRRLALPAFQPHRPSRPFHPSRADVTLIAAVTERICLNSVNHQ
jgi:hypothetical protein